MKRKWPRRLLLVIWLLLLAANVAYFLGREWESSFVPSTYATLYYPIDVPTIRQWTPVERDHLQLDLACPPSVREWRVLTDGGKEQTAAGTKPLFRLDTTFSQLHVYRLIPVPEGVCQAIEVSVRFYSREFYAERETGFSGEGHNCDGPLRALQRPRPGRVHAARDIQVPPAAKCRRCA